MRLAPLALVAALALALAPPVRAEDAGFLTRLLQDQLSDAGREVRIRGFEGALSSTARIAEMTIADDAGVWLTLRDAELDWNRAALFRRQLSVNALTAGEIVLERLPEAGPGQPPAPEATPFALPELPLRIEIGEIRAGRVALGAPVLGSPAELSLQGSARLVDGEGETRLVAERIDGAEGRLSLEGSFSNVTRQLEIDLDLTEGPAGIAATLLGLPGEPPLRLAVAGSGPLADFAADIALETEGEPRLTGRVELRDEAGAQGFRAELAGDIRPLVEEDFHGFFGAETRLDVAGRQAPDGALAVERLELATGQLSLAGSLALAPGGRPERVALTGRVAAADGQPVVLPLGGPRTTVAGVALDLAFDAARGPDWTADFRLDRLERPDMAIDAVTLAGQGRLDTGPAAFAGLLDFAATGLAPADPGLAEALGEAVTGRARIDWAEGGDVVIEGLELGGQGYGLAGDARIAGQTVTLDLAARLDELARFSGLADRPLGGTATARLAGEVATLDGAFDLDLDVTGRDLALDIAEADALLAGEARIHGGIRRDTTGTTLNALTVTATTLSAVIDGVLRSRDSDLTATLDFADLAVLGPDYAGRLTAEARLLGTGDVQRLSATATGRDLAAGIDELDRLLAGESRIALEAVLAEGVTLLERFSLGATTLAVEATGRIGRAGTELTGRLDFADLAVLGNGWRGRLTADGRFIEAAGRQQIRLAATGTDLALGIEQADALLAGQSRLTLDALREGEALDIERFALMTERGLAAQGAGRIAPERSDFEGRAGLSDLAVLGAGLAGRIDLEGRLADVAGVQRIDAGLTGRDLRIGVEPVDRLLAGETRGRIEAALQDGGVALDRASLTTATGLEATAAGRIAPGDTRLTAEAVLARLAVLGPGFGGRLALDLEFAEEADAEGEPLRSLTLNARGQDLAVGVFEVDRILRGASTFTLDASQLGERLRVRAARLVTPLLTADASATVEGTARRLDIDARLANLAALVPGFDGAAAVQGSITDAPGNAYAVDLRATGPGGINATVAGRMGRDLTAALAISGSANLALVNRFIDPINLQGPLAIDLRLDGPVGLPALSGTVSTSGARLVAPGNAVTLEEIAATARLGGSAVQIEAGAAVQGGGRIAAQGGVQLTPGFPADLSVTLDAARISDRRIFETRLSGALAVTGPLQGGGRIAGALSLDGTEMRIPSTGLGVGGYVPPGMVHIGDSAAVRETRARARVNGEAGTREGGNPFALDLTLSAPNRVFIRGRGLDAELGGALRLTGTTDDVVPSGEFSLIRGRLDLLGRRFVLSDGSAQLTGRFLPFIRLTATTVTDGITAQIVLEGEADALQIRFLSVPELPEEEVVALILFGRGLDRLSPFQAAQLASAVATLAGRGGEGLIGGLRRGFGLDDLDVSTTEEGLAALRLGRYLTENIYTDLTVDSQGRSEVSINLDVSSSVTVRARTDSEGRSGIGLFFERDY